MSKQKDEEERFNSLPRWARHEILALRRSVEIYEKNERDRTNNKTSSFSFSSGTKISSDENYLPEFSKVKAHLKMPNGKILRLDFHIRSEGGKQFLEITNPYDSVAVFPRSCNSVYIDVDPYGEQNFKEV